MLALCADYFVVNSPVPPFLPTLSLLICQIQHLPYFALVILLPFLPEASSGWKKSPVGVQLQTHASSHSSCRNR